MTVIAATGSGRTNTIHATRSRHLDLIPKNRRRSPLTERLILSLIPSSVDSVVRAAPTVEALEARLRLQPLKRGVSAEAQLPARSVLEGLNQQPVRRLPRVLVPHFPPPLHLATSTRRHG